MSVIVRACACVRFACVCAYVFVRVCACVHVRVGLCAVCVGRLGGGVGYVVSLECVKYVCVFFSSGFMHSAL